MPETVALLRANGVDAPVVVGGIIPEADQPALLAAGVARVYTPKDFRVSDIVAELAELVDRPTKMSSVHRGGAAGYRGVAVCARSPWSRSSSA